MAFKLVQRCIASSLALLACGCVASTNESSRRTYSLITEGEIRLEDIVSGATQVAIVRTIETRRGTAEHSVDCGRVVIAEIVESLLGQTNGQISFFMLRENLPADFGDEFLVVLAPRDEKVARGLLEIATGSTVEADLRCRLEAGGAALEERGPATSRVSPFRMGDEGRWLRFDEDRMLSRPEFAGCTRRVRDGGQEIPWDEIKVVLENVLFGN